MTIALWCVLVATAIPFLFTGIAKTSRQFDNVNPRIYLESTTTWRRRAYWAHLNSLEAFPPFAAAVIIAHLLAGANAHADQLAIAFVALRLAYGAAYIANLAMLRSLIWFGGLGCVIALFVLASRAA